MGDVFGDVNVFTDVRAMQEKFGAVEFAEKHKSSPETLLRFLRFRQQLLEEEITESAEALENADMHEFVDGLIDTIVIAAGTLEIFQVDSEKAWSEVHRANMAKQPGKKPGRTNTFDMPDMLKPEGWQSPDHTGNTGILPKQADQRELPKMEKLFNDKGRKWKDD